MLFEAVYVAIKKKTQLLFFKIEDCGRLMKNRIRIYLYY